MASTDSRQTLLQSQRSETMNMFALRIEEDAEHPEAGANIVESALEIDTASDNQIGRAHV